jgi:hypothetical protein
MKPWAPLALPVLLLLPATGLAQEASDGVTLDVVLGPAPGEVALAWTGGRPPYGVFRSTDPVLVIDPANLLGETTGNTWIDLPPEGETFFYKVTTSCAYGHAGGGEACFFPDTCADPFEITGPNFGPTAFSDDMENYSADVTGTCGAAGDDVIHRVDIPPASAFTAFATIVMDTTGSTIDTAVHLTRECGNPIAEPQYASAVCGASIGSGNTCANTPDGTEILRACGMPTGTYYATLDSTASTGAFTLTVAVSQVDLDTCPGAGNVSNPPLSVTATTTGKAHNFVFDQTSSTLSSCSANLRNACGVPNGDPTGGPGGICGSDGGAIAEDIVFYFRAAQTGFLTIDTQGSNFDTILYIKSGCAPTCAAPSDCLRCNDDHNFTADISWSRLYRLPVTAGTLYRIIVDGFQGADGLVQLNVFFSTT